MKEQEIQVLEQYQVDVNSTRKVRGAVLCDTKQGLLLLKELGTSKNRVPVLCNLCACLKENGMGRIDTPIMNKEGEYISIGEDEKKYILKNWHIGRECDIRREEDILAAVSNLARIHRILRNRSFDTESDGKLVLSGEDVRQMYARYNREMKKVRSFIRKKVDKGEFEQLYLKYYDSMYALADGARVALENSAYENLLTRSENEGHYTHGEYNYHNLIMTARGVATTNFEHFHQDVQMMDLYYFMRKVLEKNQWDVRLGNRILETYGRILTLKKEELDFLAILISYPEKFRKAANSYYRAKKSFIPKKNTEKLEISAAQIEMRKAFLRQIFAFHL